MPEVIEPNTILYFCKYGMLPKIWWIGDRFFYSSVEQAGIPVLGGGSRAPYLRFGFNFGGAIAFSIPRRTGCPCLFGDRPTYVLILTSSKKALDTLKKICYNQIIHLVKSATYYV